MRKIKKAKCGTVNAFGKGEDVHALVLSKERYDHNTRPFSNDTYPFLIGAFVVFIIIFLFKKKKEKNIQKKFLIKFGKENFYQILTDFLAVWELERGPSPQMFFPFLLIGFFNRC
jgi:hypothetical protein